MCKNVSNHYYGCTAAKFAPAECTQYATSHPCYKQPCLGQENIQKWQPGICPNHIGRLPQAKQEKAQEFVASSQERWNNGERRVWNYKVEDKPSSWHMSGDKCVMM
jgi:hypothetical protein